MVHEFKPYNSSDVEINSPEAEINMLNDWPKTQVFIYYNEANLKYSILPDCLGTLLSPQIVLTTATCLKCKNLHYLLLGSE